MYTNFHLFLIGYLCNFNKVKLILKEGLLMHSLTKQLFFVFFLGLVFNFQATTMESDSNSDESDKDSYVNSTRSPSNAAWESAKEKMRKFFYTLSEEEQKKLAQKGWSATYAYCHMRSPIHADVGLLCNKYKITRT